MLVSMAEMLTEARERGYAVPAFDVAGLAFVRAVVEAAAEARSPAIIMILAEGSEETLALLAALARSAAARADVPVALHLDHGRAVEECRRAIAEGFTGVMIDGAELPLSENIALTRAVVAHARPRGVGVEAELGRMAHGVEGQLTDPHEAAEFAAATEVDALAVSVGTVHGVYRAAPKLDLVRLAEIARRCPSPLVLHGGSGTPVDQLGAAVALGVAKVNFYTEVAQAFVMGFRELIRKVGTSVPLPGELCSRSVELMKCVIREKMAACRSEGRA